MENNDDANTQLHELAYQYFQKYSADSGCSNALIQILKQLCKRPTISTTQLYRAIPKKIIKPKEYDPYEHIIWIQNNGQINIFSPYYINNKDPHHATIKYLTEEIASNIIELLYQPKPLEQWMIFTAKNLPHLCAYKNYEKLLDLVGRIYENIDELKEQNILFELVDHRSLIGTYALTKNTIDHPTIYFDKILWEARAKDMPESILLKHENKRLNCDQCYFINHHRLKQYLIKQYATQDSIIK